MTAQVSQGSIFRPLLGDIIYDVVLRLKDIHRGVETIVYAEDIAVKA